MGSETHDEADWRVALPSMRVDEEEEKGSVVEMVEAMAKASLNLFR